MLDKTNDGLEEEKELGEGIMKITQSFTFGTLGEYYHIEHALLVQCSCITHTLLLHCLCIAYALPMHCLCIVLLLFLKLQIN